MKKRILLFALALVLAVGTCCFTACRDEDEVKSNVFSEETVFQLDLTMSTAIGPLSDLCHPGTLTFKPDGSVSMYVKFTPNAKIMMEELLKLTIADFVHKDTYDLNAEKTKITYHPTRESFEGQDIAIDIEKLDDNSMKIVFDIGKVIPQTTLTFYSNPDKMPTPTPEPPIEVEPDDVYSASFDAGEDAVLEEGFTLPEFKEYDEPTEITLPEAKFTRDDNIFRGWAANGKPYLLGEQYLFQPGEKFLVDAEIEFVAVWSDYASVIISGGDDAKTGSSQTGDMILPDVKIGSYVYLPANPYNYKDATKGFAYWTSTGANKVYPGGGLRVTDDTVVTPVWNEFVDVTFSADTSGGTAYIDSVVIKAPKDSKIIMPDAAYLFPSDATKGFAGWLKNGSGSVVKPGASATITDNVKYIAKFDTLVTISFEANGGEGTVPSNIVIGKNLTFIFPACNLTKEGFIFKGWRTKGSAETASVSLPGTTSYKSANTAYIADWRAIREVSFNLGTGVTGSVPAISQGETMKITLPQMTAENGDKLFDGWSDGTKVYAAGAAYTIPAGVDTVLNAVWRDLITVKFNGGTGASGAVEDIKMHETKTLTLPSNKYQVTGMQFIGWSDGDNIYQPGEAYMIPEMEGDSLTINAVWGESKPYAKDFDVKFRASQTIVPLYTNSKDEAQGLNAIMQMTELVLRSDSTADFVIKFLSDAKLKPHADELGITIAQLRAMEIDQKGISYTYDDVTKKVTLNFIDGTTKEITLTKVAKNEKRLYDSLEFKYALPQKIGAVTELVFAALDEKPTYLTETKTFTGPEVSLMGIKVTPKLTINADGTGKLKASFMSLNFDHAFNADRSAIIWYGDEGDRIEGTVTINNDGKMVISVTLLGQTIALVED